MLSRSAHEAFYGDLAWIPLKDSSYEKALHEARQRGARYMVIDVEDDPNFLKERGGGSAGPTLLLDYQRDGQRLLLFEVPRGSGP